MKFQLLLNLVVFYLSVNAISFKKTKEEKPIIGVLTLPSSYNDYPHTQYSMIAASYVEHIQAVGGIVVPIHYDSTEEQLDNIFSQVNGVFFTGGSVQFEQSNSVESKYLSTVTYLIQKVKEANNNQDYVPLWGTCLGFQAISYVESGFDKKILKKGLQDQTNHILYNIDTKSKLFSNAPKDLVEWINKQEASFYSHNDGVIYEQIVNNENLNNNIKYTSFSKSDKGVEFLATLEDINYPIYGVQFHPEKNEFEPKADANRDKQTLRASRYYMEFLINEAKKNNHKFEDLNEFNIQRVDSNPPISLQHSSYSDLYFLKNVQNPDVDYNDRYKSNKSNFFHQKTHKKNKRQQKIMN